MIIQQQLMAHYIIRVIKITQVTIIREIERHWKKVHRIRHEIIDTYLCKSIHKIFSSMPNHRPTGTRTREAREREREREQEKATTRKEYLQAAG